MILPIDALLRREVEAHRMRFTCEDCAHADVGPPPASIARCSLGFPHEAHTARTFAESESIAFCKAYELA